VGKNYNIEKMFEDFHNSPEYTAGLEKRNAKIKPRMDTSDYFSEEEKERLLVAGFEGGKTVAGGTEYDFWKSGSHDEYKEAFMKYVERYWDENHRWPLYFSPDQQSEGVTKAYEDYKEKAGIVKEHVDKGTDFRQQRDIDKDRSDAHDRLAELVYKEGKVKTLLDAKLTARMWLVADEVDSPAAITTMDRARLLREFEHLINLEREE
jgi:hypothetical protein